MGWKIAVIDSAISSKSVLIERKNLFEYYIRNGGIVRKEKMNIDCTHGTHVLNNILYECPDAEVISVAILDQNNKGKARDLLKALEFCIQEKASLINISLGISTDNTQFIDALRNLCEKAVNKGIVIISASKNSGADSYPAIFHNVISVSSHSNNGIEGYAVYNEKQNDICFCSSDIVSKGNLDYEILTGNSYLCGYVTGVLCSWYEKNGNLDEAKKIIKHLKTEDIMNRIFINPALENELSGNVQFIYFEENPFDTYILESLGAKTDKTSWYSMKNIGDLSWDCVVFGTIMLPCKTELKEDVLNWLICMKDKIRSVYCLVPIFNTKERYEISIKYSIFIKEIYA